MIQNRIWGIIQITQLTLAGCETESQFPPDNVNFPSPILESMSLGVSLGPLANGVCLEQITSHYQPYDYNMTLSVKLQNSKQAIAALKVPLQNSICCFNLWSSALAHLTQAVWRNPCFNIALFSQWYAHILYVAHPPLQAISHYAIQCNWEFTSGY